MTAPTEEDIRAELDHGWNDRGNPVTLHCPLEWALDTLSGDLKGVSSGLHDWEDMRESEIERFDEIVTEEFVDVDALLVDLRKAVSEAAVRAELRFWSEHPDAPRAVREPVTA